MTTTPLKPLPILPLRIAERCYNLLLLLYPQEHREEYGRWMAQAFRDLCREAWHEHGTLGLIEVWLHTLVDTFVTAFQERRKIVFKTSSIRGGWVAVAGGLLLLLTTVTQIISFLPAAQRIQLRQFENIGFVLMIAGMLCILFTSGLLLQRFRDQIGAAGKWILGLAVLFGLLTFALMIVLIVFHDPDGVWNMMTVFLMLHFAAWAVFGIGNLLRWSVLPQNNTLPLLVGAPLPITTVIQQLSRITPTEGFESIDVVYLLAVVIMGVSLYSLGLALSAKPRQLAAA